MVDSVAVLFLCHVFIQRLTLKLPRSSEMLLFCVLIQKLTVGMVIISPQFIFIQSFFYSCFLLSYLVTSFIKLIF